MRLSQVLWKIFYILIGPALLSTFVLYAYPLFFQCAFPTPSQPRDSDPLNESNVSKSSNGPNVAPFRLLALGDPQLEGDSSLPDPNAPLLPSLRKIWSRDYSDYSRGFPTEKPKTSDAVKGLLREDIPRLLQTYRKRLDLLGNDYYLAHIYRTLNWYLEPTHVTVLGDLIGSQWISDDEFERREWRFWNRVFKKGRRVEDDLMAGKHVDTVDNTAAWRRRIINIAGNHDIGYAGDITVERAMRFERAYGKVNGEITFTFPSPTPNTNTTTPTLRLLIFNSMNLDGPSLSPALQAETYTHLNNHLILPAPPVSDKTTGTILLTHIPLHKPNDVCIDDQYFAYGPSGVRAQNHLSEGASRPILEGIFGMHPDPAAPGGGLGRKGVILTGHDHEGCDTYHYVRRDHLTQDGDSPASEDSRWTARPWQQAAELIKNSTQPGIREITVRSMMGSFGGNAGLLSAWFDTGVGEWRFEYDTCALGVQHWWWAVHVLDMVTWGVLGGALMSSMLEKWGRGKGDEGGRAEGKEAERKRVKVRKWWEGGEGRSTVRKALEEDLADDKVYKGGGPVATGYEAGAPLKSRSRRV